MPTSRVPCSFYTEIRGFDRDLTLRQIDCADCSPMTLIFCTALTIDGPRDADRSQHGIVISEMIIVCVANILRASRR